MINAEELTAMIVDAMERSPDPEVGDEAVLRAAQIWSGLGGAHAGEVTLSPVA